VVTGSGTEQCAAGEGRLLDCLPLVRLTLNQTTCAAAPGPAGAAYSSSAGGGAVALGGAVLLSLGTGAGERVGAGCQASSPSELYDCAAVPCTDRQPARGLLLHMQEMVLRCQ
jgi:hypothetical protein